MIAHNLNLKVKVESKEILTKQLKNVLAKNTIMFQGGLIGQS